MSVRKLAERPLFPVGECVITPGAREVFYKMAMGDDLLASMSMGNYIRRHSLGDWGIVCEEDAKLNDEAVGNGTRILSAYRLQDEEHTKIWIITEADRSATTILLPSEY